MSGEVGSSGGDSNSGNDKRMGEAEGSTEWRKTPQMSRPDIIYHLGLLESPSVLLFSAARPGNIILWLFSNTQWKTPNISGFGSLYQSLAKSLLETLFCCFLVSKDSNPTEPNRTTRSAKLPFK